MGEEGGGPRPRLPLDQLGAQPPRRDVLRASPGTAWTGPCATPPSAGRPSGGPIGRLRGGRRAAERRLHGLAGHARALAGDPGAPRRRRPARRAVPWAPAERRDLSTLKTWCDEALMRVSDRAIQVHGGRGLLAETGLERIYRVARNLRIPAGTTEIQRAHDRREPGRRGATWPSRAAGARRRPGRRPRRGPGWGASPGRAAGRRRSAARASRPGPSRRPEHPSAQSSSPKRSTRSARTPGPASRNGTGSPEWMTSGEVGVAWSPVTQTIASAKRLAEPARAPHRRPRSCVACRPGPWCGRPRRWP